MILNVFNAYTKKFETVEISRWKLAKVTLGFPQPVGYRKYEKWTAPIMFYVFYCYRYGFEIDYEHGYDGRLNCEDPEGYYKD